MLSEYYDILCTYQMVATFACLWGVAQHITLKSIGVTPLTSLVNGLIEGSLYAFGAGIICEFLPFHMQGIISSLCIAAIIVQKLKELKIILFSNYLSQ
jgi:hypothetical protein